MPLAVVGEQVGKRGIGNFRPVLAEDIRRAGHDDFA